MAEPTIDLFLFLGLLIPFAIGALWDIRVRRVPDMVWWLAAIPAFAIHIAFAVIDGHSWQALVLWGVAAYLFADIFLPRKGLWGDEGGPNWLFIEVNITVMILGTAVAILGIVGQGWSRELLAPLLVVVHIGLGYLLYYARLLKGGADAKAFVLIGVFFPIYPSFAPLFTGAPSDPLDLWITLPYVAVLYGGLLSMGFPLLTFFRNAASGDWTFPGMFLRREVPIAEVDVVRYFLLNTIRDGKLVTHRHIPEIDDEEEMLHQLQEWGLERATVSYKIPLIVPMFIALLIAGFLAHPFLLLFGI